MVERRPWAGPDHSAQTDAIPGISAIVDPVVQAPWIHGGHFRADVRAQYAHRVVCAYA